MSVVNQRQIARNTLLLYIRMGLIMIISFYTSRMILALLGENDFGIYNAVGGVVVAFSFLNNVMASACNRYFAVELGRGDHAALKKVFNLNVTIFLGLGLIILLLAETVGLWFLRVKMVYPPERAMAVNWVYQLSILSFLLPMLATPYRALIIAREKMKVFAYCSVVEALLRLGIVFLLMSASFDRLVFYAFLMMVVNLGVSAFYVLYCRHCYEECRYSFFWDKPLFREIIGYTGWNVVGSLSGVARSQGVNLLLNLFFGPTVNAARGVAYQVYVNINQFVQNFVTAFHPQITKAHAAGEHQAMIKLVFQSSKFSYFLLFLLVLPVYVEMPMILDIWLKDVPQHTLLFSRLMLITALIDALGYPLATSIQATGQIKWYQVFVGGSLLLSLPIAYLMLKIWHFPAESVFAVNIATSLLAQVLRAVFMKHQQQMSLSAYVRAVLLPTLLVSALSCLAPVLIVTRMESSWSRLLLNLVCCFTLVPTFIYTLGLTASERNSLTNALKSRFLKKQSL